MDGDAELSREAVDLGLGHPSFRGEDQSDDPGREWEAKGYLTVHARNEDEARAIFDKISDAIDDMLRNSPDVSGSFSLEDSYPEEC